jgi:serine/threonine-protein kinase
VEASERKLEPGDRLDRYELLCPIAQGGMAQVWLARLHGKHGFEKLVAIKTILAAYANDLRFQQMFLDEARIASGIEHANVAQILDLGEQGNVLYLVMEWIDGDSLAKLHRAAEKAQTPFPPSIVARILIDTCAGLHAAHELRDKNGHLLNVVHRDVSPQNILVSVRGQVKLIDFGIAKARDRVADDTNTGLLKGKILYMAPEQALGKPVDLRADLWAVAAVGYHLLAGVPPFEGANQLATLHLLTSNEPPPPLPAIVPGALRDVIFSMFEREPDRRAATADELARNIEASMAGRVATSAEVARFVHTHLAERAATRKKTVDLALEAAAQRARIQSMIAPAEPDSASGRHPMPTSARASVAPPLDGDPATQIAPTPLPVDAAMLIEAPSNATIASAAVERVAPVPSIAPPASSPRFWLAAGVVAGAALLSAMALGIVLAQAARSEPPHALAARPPVAWPKPAPTASDVPTVTAIDQPPPGATTTLTTAAPSASTTIKPPIATTTRPTATATAKGTATTKPTGRKPPDDGF